MDYDRYHSNLIHMLAPPAPNHPRGMKLSMKPKSHIVNNGELGPNLGSALVMEARLQPVIVEKVASLTFAESWPVANR